MYVEGLLVPVERSRLDDYRLWAEKLADLFMEYGATRVVEAVADGLEMGKVTSFPRALLLKDGEVVVFSWLEFPDKATRDTCMKSAFEDPRIGSPEDMPMDGKRMIFAGFETLVERS